MVPPLRVCRRRCGLFHDGLCGALGADADGAFEGIAGALLVNIWTALFLTTKTNIQK